MAKTKKQKDNEKNLIKWKKGQSGNPNGRPKKSFSLLNEALQEEGYEPLKRAQLIEAYALLLNLDEEKLKELALDKEVPYGVRIIIGQLNSSKFQGKAINDLRDYMFGKAKETVENIHREQPIYSDDPEVNERLNK